jgi:hypothetical protein
VFIVNKNSPIIFHLYIEQRTESLWRERPTC